jgi:hypothetical protein
MVMMSVFPYFIMETVDCTRIVRVELVQKFPARLRFKFSKRELEVNGMSSCVCMLQLILGGTKDWVIRDGIVPSQNEA